MTLKERIAQHVATFQVGDMIEFSVYDDSFCTETSGDAEETILTGEILTISGSHATVQNEKGIFQVWLTIAKKKDVS